eukprot:g1165.t1
MSQLESDLLVRLQAYPLAFPSEEMKGGNVDSKVDPITFPTLSTLTSTVGGLFEVLNSSSTSFSIDLQKNESSEMLNQVFNDRLNFFATPDELSAGTSQESSSFVVTTHPTPATFLLAKLISSPYILGALYPHLQKTTNGDLWPLPKPLKSTENEIQRWGSKQLQLTARYLETQIRQCATTRNTSRSDTATTTTTLSSIELSRFHKIAIRTLESLTSNHILALHAVDLQRTQESDTGKLSSALSENMEGDEEAEAIPKTKRTKLINDTSTSSTNGHFNHEQSRVGGRNKTTAASSLQSPYARYNLAPKRGYLATFLLHLKTLCYAIVEIGVQISDHSSYNSQKASLACLLHVQQCIVAYLGKALTLEQLTLQDKKKLSTASTTSTINNETKMQPSSGEDEKQHNDSGRVSPEEGGRDGPATLDMTKLLALLFPLDVVKASNGCLTAHQTKDDKSLNNDGNVIDEMKDFPENMKNILKKNLERAELCISPIDTALLASFNHCYGGSHPLQQGNGNSREQQDAIRGIGLAKYLIDTHHTMTAFNDVIGYYWQRSQYALLQNDIHGALNFYTVLLDTLEPWNTSTGMDIVDDLNTATGSVMEEGETAVERDDVGKKEGENGKAKEEAESSGNDSSKAHQQKKYPPGSWILGLNGGEGAAFKRIYYQQQNSEKRRTDVMDKSLREKLRHTWFMGQQRDSLSSSSSGITNMYPSRFFTGQDFLEQQEQHDRGANSAFPICTKSLLSQVLKRFFILATIEYIQSNGICFGKKDISFLKVIGPHLPANILLELKMKLSSHHSKGGGGTTRSSGADKQKKKKTINTNNEDMEIVNSSMPIMETNQSGMGNRRSLHLSVFSGSLLYGGAYSYLCNTALNGDIDGFLAVMNSKKAQRIFSDDGTLALVELLQFIFRGYKIRELFNCYSAMTLNEVYDNLVVRDDIAIGGSSSATISTGSSKMSSHGGMDIESKGGGGDSKKRNVNQEEAIHKIIEMHGNQVGPSIKILKENDL